MLSFAMDDLDPFLYPKLIQEVTKEKVEKLLQEIFQENCLSLSLILPTEERSNL